MPSLGAIELHQHDVLRILTRKQADERRCVVASRVTRIPRSAASGSALSRDVERLKVSLGRRSLLDDRQQHLLYGACHLSGHYSSHGTSLSAINHRPVERAHFFHQVRLEKLPTVGDG